MFLRSRLVEKQTGGFDDDVGTDFIPFQFSRVLDRSQADFFAVHHQCGARDRYLALEFAVHRVVAQHVGEVVRLQQVVDADDFDIGKILHRCAKYHATDTPEPVDADLDCHDASGKSC
jgi:hypothetical protein